MKKVINIFLLGLTSLILLSTCTPGRSVVFYFPNILDGSKTTRCDTRLNGDWKLTQLSKGQQPVEKVPTDLKNLLFVHFKTDKNCKSNTIIVIFKDKNKQVIASSTVSQTLKFPAYKNGEYFSFNFINNKNKQIKRKRNMLFKYKHINRHTLEIAMPATEFISEAIKQKLIAGDFQQPLKGSYTPPYTVPQITASKTELTQFIEEYSHSIFSLKMIFNRLPKTQ